MEKGVKLRFTVDELLNAGSHKWKESEVDAVTLRNIDDLVRKLNALGFAPPRYASSCLRSIKDQQRINPKAMGSAHLYGAAVDISDPSGGLTQWLLSTTAGGQKLVDNGLWMENPDYTKGWVHLQSYAPKSKNRVFIP